MEGEFTKATVFRCPDTLSPSASNLLVLEEQKILSLMVLAVFNDAKKGRFCWFYSMDHFFLSFFVVLPDRCPYSTQMYLTSFVNLRKECERERKNRGSKPDFLLFLNKRFSFSPVTTNWTN